MKRSKKRYKLKTNKLVYIVIPIVIILLVYFIIDSLKPSIKLNGKSDITLNYKEHYEEPGFKAYSSNEDVTSKVKVEGVVNTEKIGVYKIKYEVKNSLLTRVVIRTVRVVDKEKPVLEINGDINTFVCPNNEYKELGFKAYDNYDGDLTSKVKVNKSRNEVVYIVKDSSNNETVIKRKIEYKDIEEPKIELTDSENIFVDPNSSYTERGYKAYDNCDGDLSIKVKVEGEVNTSNIGVYEVKYKVTDSSNNTKEVIRKVNVFKRSGKYNGGKPGVVYLTFDDGPNEGSTNKVLSVLKKYNIKATFFVTNYGPDYLMKQAFDEGHTVALHTATHDYKKVYSSIENYYKDLFSVSERVKRVTGVESKLVRFPGGSSNTISRKYSKGIMTYLTNDLLKKGYKYYDWNGDVSDAGSCAHAKNKEDCVFNNFKNSLSRSRSNVVLLHDVKMYTANALERMIQYALSNNYTFDKIVDSTPMTTFKVLN